MSKITELFNKYLDIPNNIAKYDLIEQQEIEAQLFTAVILYRKENLLGNKTLNINLRRLTRCDNDFLKKRVKDIRSFENCINISKIEAYDCEATSYNRILLLSNMFSFYFISFIEKIEKLGEEVKERKYKLVEKYLTKLCELTEITPEHLRVEDSLKIFFDKDYLTMLLYLDECQERIAFRHFDLATRPIIFENKASDLKKARDNYPGFSPQMIEILNNKKYIRNLQNKPTFTDEKFVELYNSAHNNDDSSFIKAQQLIMGDENTERELEEFEREFGVELFLPLFSPNHNSLKTINGLSKIEEQSKAKVLRFEDYRK